MPTITPMQLGFLTVLKEEEKYLGGYLVTNNWGRPLEFRLSSAVQPNPVQEILYADTLMPYIYGELIGKTLVEKTSLTPELIITEEEEVLDLRRHLPIPVVWLAPLDAQVDSSARIIAQEAEEGQRVIYTSREFLEDLPDIQEQLARLKDVLDLEEPFRRIREAVSEARKLGVSNRAA